MQSLVALLLRLNKKASQSEHKSIQPPIHALTNSKAIFYKGFQPEPLSVQFPLYVAHMVCLCCVWPHPLYLIIIIITRWIRPVWVQRFRSYPNMEEVRWTWNHLDCQEGYQTVNPWKSWYSVCKRYCTWWVYAANGCTMVATSTRERGASEIMVLKEECLSALECSSGRMCFSLWDNCIGRMCLLWHLAIGL